MYTYMYMYVHPNLCRKEGELVVLLQVHQVGVLAGHQVAAVVPVEDHPVAAPVHRDVLGQLAVAHAPHVVVALHKGPVQPLLLNEPFNFGGSGWVAMGGRKGGREERVERVEVEKGRRREGEGEDRGWVCRTQTMSSCYM